MSTREGSVPAESLLDLIDNQAIISYVKDNFAIDEVWNSCEIREYTKDNFTLTELFGGESVVVEYLEDQDYLVIPDGGSIMDRLQKQLDRIKHKQAFSTWDAAEELERLMDICEDLVR